VYWWVSYLHVKWNVLSTCCVVGSDSESYQDDNVVGNVSKSSVVAPGYTGPIKRGHLIFNADFECGKHSFLCDMKTSCAVCLFQLVAYNCNLRDIFTDAMINLSPVISLHFISQRLYKHAVFIGCSYPVSHYLSYTQYVRKIMWNWIWTANKLYLIFVTCALLWVSMY